MTKEKYAEIVALQLATSAKIAAAMPAYDWAGATRLSGVADPSYARGEMLLWPAGCEAPATNKEALAGLRSGKYAAAVWSSSSGGWGHGPHRSGTSVVTPDEVTDLIAADGTYSRSLGTFGGCEASYNGYLIVVPGPYQWGRDFDYQGYGPYADNGFVEWAAAHGLCTI